MRTLRFNSLCAAALTLFVIEPARAQPVTPKVQALLHVVRAEALDTVVAWMLVDSASLRSAAHLTSKEFDTFTRNLGPRASLLDGANGAVCPVGSESRCLTLEVNAIAYERKSWFVSVTVRMANSRCGISVELYRVGFFEQKPVTLLHENGGVGDCAPPRKPSGNQD